MGYVNAGRLVINHQNIYSDPLNTWPPFFSIFCIPLTIADNFSPYGVRMIWLIGSIVAMYLSIKIGVRLLTNKGIGFREDPNLILFQSSLILIPFLISFRYLLDNLANIQINIFMLLMALVVHQLITKRSYKWAGFILAFSISLKVYTIFLFFYYLFKRKNKLVLFTIFFFVAINLIPFLIFGNEIAIHYYDIWWNEIASTPQTAHHKNQSIFGTLLRLFSNDFPGHSYYINVANFSLEKIKITTYGLIGFAALYPAFLFSKTSSSLKTLCEVAFVFGAIPILTPLSWKAYFIFLWFPYFIVYYLVWYKKYLGETKKEWLVKTLFWTSVVFTVFTTEGIIGDYLSDILESYSIIFFGTVLLLLSLLLVYPEIED